MFLMKKMNIKKKIGILGVIAFVSCLGAWYVRHDSFIKATPKEEATKKVAAEEKSVEATNLERNRSSPAFGVFSKDRQASVNSYITLHYNFIWLNVSEVISKTNEELINDIESIIELNVEAFNITGTPEARISDVTSLTETARGGVDITAEVKAQGRTYNVKVKVMVLPNGVFGKGDGTGWQELPLGTEAGVLENPLTKAKIGFPKRGVNTTPNNPTAQTDTGFLAVDKDNKGYNFAFERGLGSGRVSNVPYRNGRPLYLVYADIRQSGLGWEKVDDRSILTEKMFLRKGRALKELLYDASNEILYVYDLTLEKNLNFTVSLSMYNLSANGQEFSMLEAVDTDYYTDYIPIKVLGNNEGFYFNTTNETDEAVRFAIKLKKNGQWLSDYTKFAAIEYGKVLRNQFSDQFTLPGQEALNLPKDSVLLENADTAYQLGAVPKFITQDEALKVGYEMFVGDELPYMVLSVEPKSIDVYNDQKERLLKTYTDLTEIPIEGETGNITVTYPDGQEETTPFIADNQKSFKGEYDIKLDKLPNDEVGSIAKNVVNMLAYVESSSPWAGLPSNDTFVNVNVYNFGGTAALQHVLQNSTWTKEAKELIVDPVALPNHPIDYEYENGEIPDTSKLGLQWIGVRMTDRQDKTQSKVIKVPVLVDKNPLSKGLWLNAEDMYIESSDVTGQTSTKIKEFILDRSNAMGIDLSNQTMDGVTLEVANTDLTGRPDDTKPGPYKATIVASKSGMTSVSKEINIYLVNEPVINAHLEVAKPEIILGEKNTYTATFKDEAPNPTKLLDVTLGTSALPDFVTADVDSFRVKIGDDDEKVLAPQDIIFDPGGALDIKLHEIPAGAQVTVTFDFLTSMDVPPPSFDEYDATFELEYLFKGRRVDGKPIRDPFYSNLTEFLILEPTSAIEINYLMEDTNTPIPNEYTKTMSGNIGDESDLLEFSIDNYVLSKVQFDGKDQVLPTQAFKVKFGDVEKITFYYKGVLKIKSAPTAYDFGLEVSSSKKIRVDNPTPIGMPFIVADTRTSSPGWSLKVKLTEELLNDDGKTTLKNAVRYKSGKTETILNNQAIKVVQKVNPGEYDVSKDWSATGDGLKLEIAPGAVNALGKYHGEILFELGETP